MFNQELTPFARFNENHRVSQLFDVLHITNLVTLLVIFIWRNKAWHLTGFFIDLEQHTISLLGDLHVNIPTVSFYYP